MRKLWNRLARPNRAPKRNPVTLRVTYNDGRYESVTLCRDDTLVIWHTVALDQPTVEMSLRAKAATIEVL